MAWWGALRLNSILGCAAVGKRPLPCIVLGFDLLPILSFLAWWGMLLWIPALLVSGLLVARVLLPLARPPFGTKRTDHRNA